MGSLCPIPEPLCAGILPLWSVGKVISGPDPRAGDNDSITQ